jgi:hypothetical protein
MDFYVFSSINLTNIWAGIGAQKWAISANQANSSGTNTKSKSIKIGSLGLLYCSDSQEFTTPFIITSVPLTGVSISNIWPEEWWFPFGMHPLGTPDKRLHKDNIKQNLPSLINTQAQWNRVLYVQPNFVFQKSLITTEDWEYLFQNLKY